MKARAMKAVLVTTTPMTMTALGPRRSMTGPTAGAMREPRAEPAAMAPLTKDPDPYLAANAAVFELRSLVERTDLEAAHTRLTELGKDEAALRMHTLLAADVRFLTGYCQLHTLAYQAALETLESFEKDYPNAPERLRVTAKQIVQELKRRKPDGLGDVADLMAYAGRRLGIGVSGLAVVEKQIKAVALLDELIKQAEEKESKDGECKACEGKGCKACKGGAPKGNQTPSSPAAQSLLPGGSARIGDLRKTIARPGASWGSMPQAERDRILQAIKKNFPTRYRKLVEQYYKQLAKDQ